jgi:hypothetical protein
LEIGKIFAIRNILLSFITGTENNNILLWLLSIEYQLLQLLE